MKQGKRAKEWLTIRKEWIAANPPNHAGEYLCAVCLKPVKADAFELHHVWGRKGSLLSNAEHLVPTHALCNQEVGSKRGVRNAPSSEYELRRQLEL